MRTLLLLLTLAHGSAGPVYYTAQGGRYAEDPRHRIRGDQAVLGYIRYLENSGPSVVTSRRGANATLPCRMRFVPSGYRVKWVKMNGSPRENIVLVGNSHQQRGYGTFARRASLRRLDRYDVSLSLLDVRLEDEGKFKCELINGVDDEAAELELQLDGVVFPYQPRQGRYQFNYHQAVRACQGQDARIARLSSSCSKVRAGDGGLEWCNAGWLEDGSVQYPVTLPRDPCGGRHLPPGIRNYGTRNKQRDRFDTYCFTSSIKGYVYFRKNAQMFDYQRAVRACRSEGATIAKVGQMYAAWSFSRLHRCEPGWLADGSVRFPISSPHPQCGGTEPGVRSHGFPSLARRQYGVYCYKSR
ncbi:LOW QUALITY PROTEIN: hyaluronan and proteoglycan link protein 2-like [Leucoraja erinacea]|uniref:LOW QUALITY PROTEIN: hyaluronan and proteoglycan link protein 2-like n=1 Tax=Leucoraja erinaceus TaxID=7782 RepID=UPI002453F828|nr:LOW QUALITY PROTEIN: hyaluronan and proteoglycan link protein 2-like [Leucoraja erinacea]